MNIGVSVPSLDKESRVAHANSHRSPDAQNYPFTRCRTPFLRKTTLVDSPWGHVFCADRMEMALLLCSFPPADPGSGLAHPTLSSPHPGVKNETQETTFVFAPVVQLRVGPSFCNTCVRRRACAPGSIAALDKTCTQLNLVEPEELHWNYCCNQRVFCAACSDTSACSNARLTSALRRSASRSFMRP